MRYAAIFFLLLQFLHADEDPHGWVSAASKTKNASLSALCHSIHVRAHHIRTRPTGKVPIGGITGSEFLLMREGDATIEDFRHADWQDQSLRPGYRLRRLCNACRLPVSWSGATVIWSHGNPVN
jgi:hypothetical protein